MRQFKSLSAQVRRFKGTGKCRTVTEVVICAPRAGQVARAVLGGDYSPAQALAEYLRQPQRFEVLPAGKLARAMGVKLP